MFIPTCHIFKIIGNNDEDYRFVLHGILLTIVAIFGILSNLISAFIFTRPEMRTPTCLILTGKKIFCYYIVCFVMKLIILWPINSVSIFFTRCCFHMTKYLSYKHILQNNKEFLLPNTTIIAVILSIPFLQAEDWPRTYPGKIYQKSVQIY